MPSRNACPSLVLQENICLKYTAAGGDNGTKNLVMELENARSHDQQTYAVVFSFIVLCLLLLYPILLHDAATSGVRTPSPITHTHTHTHTHTGMGLLSPTFRWWHTKDAFLAFCSATSEKTFSHRSHSLPLMAMWLSYAVLRRRKRPLTLQRICGTS